MVSVFFIKKYPLVLLIPILISLLSVYVLYTAISVKKYSKKSILPSLITFLLIPILYLFLEAIFLNSALGGSGLLISIFRLSINPLNIIPLLLIIPGLLITNKLRKQEIEERFDFSKLEKIIIIVSIVITLISSIIVNSVYILNYQKTINLGSLKSIQPKVPYKIYTIPKSKLPKDHYYTRNIEINSSILSINNGVSILIGSPIKDLTSGMFIYEAKVPDDFNLTNYINSQLLKENSKLKSNHTVVDLTNSVDSKAHLLTRYNSNSITANSLYFVTNDNVLIAIKTTSFSESEIIQLAEYLQ